ncbi:Possible transposase [Brevundimonas diminuta 3F5N]|uniref:Possible transposase n=1 Tax=Brevundimonas diminuta 3F5N TaxID=1255603 RepID=A0A1R4EP46_BREDI|nr:IS1595 family transposase [Brevundimonas diminuta]SJM45467.1 Possible transposase [Brevundimonas diminuta 3F5N]
MPFDVGAWTEDEARAQFAAFRWAEFGGRPTCQRCGCDAVNRYKSRPIYKCKGCWRQFSDKSGTPWANAKIKYRNLMYLISLVSENVQATSIRQLAKWCRVNYKTAFVWVQKIREEISRKAKETSLEGEVEIDGAYFGGHVRPKNMKKTRKDLRKIPYRANDRALSVVAARQRGGGICTWVAKQETHARSFIADAIKPGSVLFTDKAAGWGPLRGRFSLFQVDHSSAFYTPEACTNGVETLWALMRIMERIHRHITQNYLDLYAADAAWTLTKGKKPEGEAFREVMTWMSRPGRSPLAGYFQGRKRTCPVCKPDGTIEGWKPAPKKGRTDFVRKGVELVPYRPRCSLEKTWPENFKFVSTAEFVSNPATVPDGPGVYALFVREGDDLLRASGFVEQDHKPLWRRGTAVHVYTGETYGLRTRLTQHLLGGIETSNLRATLAALQFNPELIGLASDNGRTAVEAGLSEWLKANTLIGFKSCGYVRDVETVMLNAVASPLNVQRSNGGEYARRLLELRKRFGEIASRWPPPSTGPSRQRRR